MLTTATTLIVPGGVMARGLHSILRSFCVGGKKGGSNSSGSQKESPSHYKVLGIKQRASNDDIKRAYVRAIRDAEARGDDILYARVATAYHVLSDRALRQAYDKSGCKETLLPPSAQQQQQQQNSSSASSSDEDDDDDSNEPPRSRTEAFLASVLNENGIIGMLGVGPVAKFVGDMIGIKQPSPQEAAWGSEARVPRSGPAPRTVVLSLTLAEAIRGGKRSVPVPLTHPCGACAGRGEVPLPAPPSCSACRGKGVVGGTSCRRCKGTGLRAMPKCAECAGMGVKRTTRNVSVWVPFGAIDGEVIQTSVKHGKTTIPVFVQISVKGHPVFRRDNNDIHVEVPLSIAQASLGGRVKLPMIDGSFKTVRVQPHHFPYTQLIYLFVLFCVYVHIYIFLGKARDSEWRRGHAL